MSPFTVSMALWSPHGVSLYIPKISHFLNTLWDESITSWACKSILSLGLTSREIGDFVHSGNMLWLLSQTHWGSTHDWPSIYTTLHASSLYPEVVTAWEGNEPPTLGRCVKFSSHALYVLPCIVTYFATQWSTLLHSDMQAVVSWTLLSSTAPWLTTFPGANNMLVVHSHWPRWIKSCWCTSWSTWVPHSGPHFPRLPYLWSSIVLVIHSQNYSLWHWTQTGPGWPGYSTSMVVSTRHASIPLGPQHKIYNYRHVSEFSLWPEELCL